MTISIAAKLRTTGGSLNAVAVVLSTLLVSSLIVAVPQAASAADGGYGAAADAYHDFGKAVRAKAARSKWHEVIAGFADVVNKAESGSESVDENFLRKALFMVGELSRELYRRDRKDSDGKIAMEAYAKLVERFPDSKLADDSRLAMGGIHEAFRDKPAAYLAYKDVIDNYPDGDQVAQAKRRIKPLRKYAPQSTDEIVRPVVVAERTTVEASRPAKSDEPAILTKIDTKSSDNYTRIVIETDHRVEYTPCPEPLPGDEAKGLPPRLYIDFAGTKLARGMTEEVPIGDGLLKRARVGQNRADVARVVLDIETIKKYKIFHLPQPFRVIVDVFGDGVVSAPALVPSPVATVTAPPAPQLSLDELIATVPEPKVDTEPLDFQHNKRRIMIDAGHGGKDPGAIGHKGLQEKDVTLKIAKRVGDLLEKEYNLEVFYTREKDEYPTLTDRTAAANAKMADVFVSIHINSNNSSKPSGLTTYYLGEADDEKVAEIAARENGTTVEGLSDLEFILQDMQLTQQSNESAPLATLVQKEMSREAKRYNKKVADRGVKRAPFFVLVGAEMPSILIEAGFISNRTDESRLGSESYLSKLAQGIAGGINRYQREYLPPLTPMMAESGPTGVTASH